MIKKVAGVLVATWKPRTKNAGKKQQEDEQETLSMRSKNKEILPCAEVAKFMSSENDAATTDTRPSDFNPPESKVPCEETKNTKGSESQNNVPDNKLVNDIQNSRVRKHDSQISKPCSQPRSHVTHFVPIALASKPRHLKPPYRPAVPPYRPPAPPVAVAITKSPDERDLMLTTPSLQHLTFNPWGWDIVSNAQHHLLQNPLCIDNVCHADNDMDSLTDTFASIGGYRVQSIASHQEHLSLPCSGTTTCEDSSIRSTARDTSWRGNALTLNSSYTADSTLMFGSQDDESGYDCSTGDDDIYDFYY